MGPMSVRGRKAQRSDPSHIDTHYAPSHTQSEESISCDRVHIAVLRAGMQRGGEKRRRGVSDLYDGAEALDGKKRTVGEKEDSQRHRL